MKTIAFIVPYIGNFPSYFDLWLRSCGDNPTIDWLVFTDNSKPEHCPQNVRFYHFTMDDLRTLYQSNFDFPISFERIYKTCDFKPAYGEIFQEYIRDYDFWGHCDVDLIWGDIRKFVTEELLAAYDKIGIYGHCILTRNTPTINALYKTTVKGLPSYREAYASAKAYAFDETYGMEKILKATTAKVYDEPMFYDVLVAKKRFEPSDMSMMPKYAFLNGRKGVFVKDSSGISYCYIDGKELKKEPFMYVHIQKRIMKKLVDSGKGEYIIAPNVFLPYRELNKSEIQHLMPSAFIPYWANIRRELKSKWAILINDPKRMKSNNHGRFERIVMKLLGRTECIVTIILSSIESMIIVRLWGRLSENSDVAIKRFYL